MKAQRALFIHHWYRVHNLFISLDVNRCWLLRPPSSTITTLRTILRQSTHRGGGSEGFRWVSGGDGSYKQGTCHRVCEGRPSIMEHGEGAGPTLRHVYCSPLYKVWENTAANWGFDQGGAARGDKKQPDKRWREGANTGKQYKCNLLKFLHPYHSRFSISYRYGEERPVSTSQLLSEETSPARGLLKKPLRPGPLGAGNNKPSLARWKWQHGPPPPPSH